LFTPLPIHFQLNLNTNTERVNSLNIVIYVIVIFSQKLILTEDVRIFKMSYRFIWISILDSV